MAKPKLDPSLIVISDRALLRGASGLGVAEAARAAAAGGATVFQLREKELGGRELWRLAEEVRRALEGTPCLFFVNDRLDVALAAGAHGVHLGQEDLPLGPARRVAGEGFLIGVSAGFPHLAREAEEGGADYVGTGPIYATSTKADARPPIGPEGLRKVAEAVRRTPVVAIGGVDAENLGPVIAAGAAGVAVIAAVMRAKDVEAAARKLRRAIESVHRESVHRKEARK